MHIPTSTPTPTSAQLYVSIRYPELSPEERARIQQDVRRAKSRAQVWPGCLECRTTGPTHCGEVCCRMGTSLRAGGDTSHCTCDGCF